MLAELHAWGAPPDVIEQALADIRLGELEILAVNVPTLRAFLAVSTQWRRGPTGVICGLDYSAVDIALRRLELALTPTEWSGLQAMEREAVAAALESLE